MDKLKIDMLQHVDNAKIAQERILPVNRINELNKLQNEIEKCKTGIDLQNLNKEVGKLSLQIKNDSHKNNSIIEELPEINMKERLNNLEPSELLDITNEINKINTDNLKIQMETANNKRGPNNPQFVMMEIDPKIQNIIKETMTPELSTLSLSNQIQNVTLKKTKTNAQKPEVNGPLSKIYEENKEHINIFAAREKERQKIFEANNKTEYDDDDKWVGGNNFTVFGSVLFASVCTYKVLFIILLLFVIFLIYHMTTPEPKYQPKCNSYMYAKTF
jgi:hypothetical protein